ncbi:MAG TPA: ligase-associated DNA damage response exonuclease, partial [Cytophagaceae bacterium]
MLEFKDKGLYCPQANIYIDPWLPVDNALITHAHSDHSRRGSKRYLAHTQSASVMRLRLGSDIELQTIDYNKDIFINGVKISFHPAGHIIGSAQIRLEHKGEVWVVSGDYKTEYDGLSPAFEPVKCHAFITESTFGLPIYKWKPQEEIYKEINTWWAENSAAGLTSVLFGYPLGKIQRLLFHLDRSIGRVFAHGAVINVNEALINDGAPIPLVERVNLEANKKDFAGSIVLATPSALGTPWIRKFQPYSTGLASGWMNLRGAKRRRPVDRGFVLSDHADWPSLLQTIKDTEAEKIFVTHGYKSAF